MPPIFKVLASITAWVLFISGCLGMLGGFIRLIGVATGAFLAPAEMPPIVCTLAGGVICLILSVCAMKLRQMLE